MYDDNGALRLESGTCTSPDPLAFAVSTASWQNGGWHFVRVVHSGGMVTLCVDGARASSFDRPAGATDDVTDEEIEKAIAESQSAIKKVPR